MKPLLFLAPLDWGLGHTTRVIPLIKSLLELDLQVVVGCNSTQKALLEKEFTNISFVSLEGYDISYGSSRTATFGKLLLSIIKILTKVKREQMWFLRFLEQNQVDAVISDNRYGLHHPAIPGIFITHQLNVISGFGKLADALIRRFLYRHVNRFSECWVPDYEGSLNLAGKLSHPAALPKIPVKYLGCLSRFTECGSANETSTLILLSGPEPQRTIFERRILKEITDAGLKDIILVRGKPADRDSLPAIPGVQVLNHAGALQLNMLACTAKLIISRSGYTTIMDMLKLKKKMVTVPTPGQSEQEYLAQHLSAKNIAPFMLQKDFSVQKAILLSNSYHYNLPELNTAQYKAVIDEFIASRFSL